MENTKYCIFCGAENAADADTCRVCGKTMHPQENLLKDTPFYRITGIYENGEAQILAGVYDTELRNQN